MELPSYLYIKEEPLTAAATPTVCVGDQKPALHENDLRSWKGNRYGECAKDDDAQRKSVVQNIHNTVLIEELDMQLLLDTSDPYKLLEMVKANQNTGIYFLDIDLKCDMNGMKLAQEIRKFDPRGFIVFITAHSELSYMTFQYRVEAMDFVLRQV